MQAYRESTNVLPKAQGQACQCRGGRGEDGPLSHLKISHLHFPLLFIYVTPQWTR